LESAYEFGDTAIGTLLGLGAASTRGGQDDDRSAGGGRLAHNSSEGEPASATLRDSNAEHHLASTSCRVDKKIFDVSDCDDVQSGMQLQVGLPPENSVRSGPTAQTEPVKPQAANLKSPRKSRMKKKKKWSDFARSRNERENGDFNKKSKFLNVHQRKNLR
jgi:hypothetical protein